MNRSGEAAPLLREPPRALTAAPRSGAPLEHALLLRSVRFTARHRYHRTGWSEERNREVFGANTEPHAHEWRIEVTVRGPVDPETGWAVDLAALDALLEREVVARFADRDVHEGVEAMAGGRVQPSTEELARWIFQRLEPRIPGDARLLRVRVEEGPELAAVYPAPGSAERA